MHLVGKINPFSFKHVGSLSKRNTDFLLKNDFYVIILITFVPLPQLFPDPCNPLLTGL